MGKEIAVELVATKILVVRGKKVMLDRDLAELYGGYYRSIESSREEESITISI